MLPLSAARELIAQQVTPIPAVLCPLAEAQGRRLREEVRALEDFPAFDRSSMDGYAVALDDVSTSFRVVGKITPGVAPNIELRPGECVRIFTGSAIPRGASQVIMQEDVRLEGEMMVPVERGQTRNIRFRGEDALAGDLLLISGTVLGAGELALLAQAGCVCPTVSPRARVIHVTTGGELVPPTVRPAPGEIRDSNSTLIAALLREVGAELCAQGRTPDDPLVLRSFVESQPAEAWDVLLISGGASVGDYDFGGRVLQAMGFEILFAGLNLKPGKPLIFARRGAQLAFVIPGNPVSHFVTFHVAIRAALEALTGGAPRWRVARAALDASLPEFRDHRETYWPAHLYACGELRVRPLRQASSGDLGALVGANCLIRIVPPCAAVEAGECVEVVVLGAV